MSVKARATVDWGMVNKIRRGLEDVKHGRVTEWKPAR